MAQKPSIPKGTRDFSPTEMAKRNYIFDTIKNIFKLYGFQQIETPAMENLSTLMGKYGEEGDKLLFKILNSGDAFNDISTKDPEGKKTTLLLLEKKHLLEDELNEIVKYIGNSSSDNISEPNFFVDLCKQSSITELILQRIQKKIKKSKYDREKLLAYLRPNYFISLLQKSKDSYSTQNILSAPKNDYLEKGLRYDLTVPFARYVVQYQNDITFPFRRYQIQPVWRADRPQKGRYREFYQCDVDIIGSNSLLNEVELVQIVDAIFRNLHISVVLKINNRKILAGIAETIGEADRIVDITVAIDKLDKIGLDKVNEELLLKGVSEEAIVKLQPILKLNGNNEEKLNQIEKVIGQSEIGMKGIKEMRTIFDYLATMSLETEIELDLTLARGLNYYTGAIFEVKSKDVQIGSITGGGRYDDLTGIFGLHGVSGVGISFGADRIYDVMSQLDLFPKDAIASTQVMFVNFGEKEEQFCLPLLSQLRAANISSEIYPDADKMKKQMNYANRKGVKFVALAGESELQMGMINLKNMETGDQQLIKATDLVAVLLG